jgi:hypothetical protein
MHKTNVPHGSSRDRVPLTARVDSIDPGTIMKRYTSGLFSHRGYHAPS